MQTNKQEHKNRLLIGTSIALSMAMSVPIVAQDQAADEDIFALEEILVTASKRTESLQDVGMSISAMSSLDIERSGVTEFLDYAVKVPNLGFAYESDGRFDANSPSIRGVFGANTTGFYIDDIPVPASMDPRVMDISRAEILRGPQGSLYGARSMGGTIRLITKQPDFNDQEIKLHAKLSSVNEGKYNWAFDGSVNIPVVDDKLAVRANAYYGHNSGIFDRVHRKDPSFGPGTPEFQRRDNVDTDDFVGIGITAKAKLSDTLTFTPNFMYQQVKAGGLPYADHTPENTLQKRFFDIAEPGSDEWFLMAGTFSWDLDSGTVTSSTSYFDRFIREMEEEGEFLENLLNNIIGIPSVPWYAPLEETVDYSSVSHETRYTSAFDGPFQLIAGVFYQRTKRHLSYPPAFALGASETGIIPNDFIYETNSFFNTKEIAAFGEVSFEATESLKLTVGGRWYNAKSDSVADADGFANGGPSRSEGKASESGFNPKFLIQFAASDELNLYASGAKGYRLPGINGNISETLCGAELDALGVNAADVTSFNSDSLWSYEAGAKASSSDNRFKINGAAYFIKWKDIQQQNRLGCGFQFTDNAGEAEIKGFELEFSAVPIQGLTFDFGIGYANAEITDTGGVAGVNVGDKIQGVPNWTFTGSGEYIFPVGDDSEAFLRADLSRYGRSFSANNESSAATQRLRPAWTTVNMRVGVIKDNWEVALFVDNLTDKRANLGDNRSIAAELSTRQRLVTIRPRTIGIETRFNF